MRNVASEYSAIELYNFNGAEDLTLSQLVVALCVRAGAVFERDAVVQLNLMNSGVSNAEELATWGDQVLEGSEWSNIRPKLISKYGVKDSALPASIEGYTDRMNALEQIVQKLTDQNSSIDRIAIEIDGAFHFETDENYRRDRRKDFLLQRHGYLVIRFLAEDVTRRIGDVLETVFAALK